MRVTAMRAWSLLRSAVREAPFMLYRSVEVAIVLSLICLMFKDAVLPEQIPAPTKFAAPQLSASSVTGKLRITMRAPGWAADPPGDQMDDKLGPGVVAGGGREDGMPLHGAHGEFDFGRLMTALPAKVPTVKGKHKVLKTHPITGEIEIVPDTPPRPLRGPLAEAAAAAGAGTPASAADLSAAAAAAGARRRLLLQQQQAAALRLPSESAELKELGPEAAAALRELVSSAAAELEQQSAVLAARQEQRLQRAAAPRGQDSNEALAIVKSAAEELERMQAAVVQQQQQRDAEPTTQPDAAADSAAEQTPKPVVREAAWARGPWQPDAAAT